MIIDIENDATVESIKKAFTAKRIVEALNVVSPDADERFEKKLGASDVEKICFVKNEAISDEVLSAAKANLFKAAPAGNGLTPSATPN